MITPSYGYSRIQSFSRYDSLRILSALNREIRPVFKANSPGVVKDIIEKLLILLKWSEEFVINQVFM
jgi:hypothetical protein